MSQITESKAYNPIGKIIKNNIQNFPKVKFRFTQVKVHPNMYTRVNKIKQIFTWIM